MHHLSLLSLSRPWRERLFPARRPARFVVANSIAAHHAGAFTALAKAATTSRHLLVKFTTQAREVEVCGPADRPVGLTLDEADKAGEGIAVALLGAQQSSQLGQASGPVAQGDFLVPGANGTVRQLPTAAGTYALIGQALADAHNGELVPFDPIPAIPHTVGS